MPVETLTFPALDGRILHGTLSRPDVAAHGAVVVFGALGVPHRYYARFAAHLAARGLAVLSFDYRGAGASRDRPSRSDDATLLEWGRFDTGGAVDALADRFPGLPSSGVGHSFGGQSFGLNPRARDLDRVVIVGAGVGDLALYPPALARKYRVLLGGFVPVAGALFGYIPGRMGLGEDLPRGVVEQWARWCNTPGYMVGALGEQQTGFHHLEAPLLFVEVPDDDFAPPGPAAALRAAYRRASVTHRVVAPDELPPGARGHFGIFRAGGEAVWDELAAFLGGPAAGGAGTTAEIRPRRAG